MAAEELTLRYPCLAREWSAPISSRWLGRLGQLDRAAGLGRQAVRQPGPGGARFDSPAGRAVEQRFTQDRIEQDPRSFGRG